MPWAFKKSKRPWLPINIFCKKNPFNGKILPETDLIIHFYFRAKSIQKSKGHAKFFVKRTFFISNHQGFWWKKVSRKCQFGRLHQVLNRPCVMIITNAGSSIILNYSVLQPLNNYSSQKKARTESNWKTKHMFIFVLIILRAAFVMIVTYRWFKTCSQCPEEISPNPDWAAPKRSPCLLIPVSKWIWQIMAGL